MISKLSLWWLEISIDIHSKKKFGIDRKKNTGKSSTSIFLGLCLHFYSANFCLLLRDIICYAFFFNNAFFCHQKKGKTDKAIILPSFFGSSFCLKKEGKNGTKSKFMLTKNLSVFPRKTYF